ncbi:low molecular weight protein-tyrosine-phosphatase [Neptunitalea lumnitzerae]|uniref:protein-tyrosine-phosphatase n=1 Tax=Neptunitalea lumnitzerae TaxID=2965509 RepID=A0ABQ5MKA1_9FLAO|nr:low molecular weight protein-tyrosine-phosphatase [Neptunitalea sp. Y10]GLB49762.1 protein-tyrosine-phosphatase [Neptunitalea sp. Y10]
MKTKILMVCLGNICRSPLAEGIFKDRLDPEKFIVDSAGTGGYHIGELPDRRSIDIAKQFNIDITDQRCRQFKKSDFAAFDHIFVMDQSNYNNVIALASNEKDIKKVQLILNLSFPKENLEVPDPYYGGKDGFLNVYKMLDTACDAFIKKYA